MSTGTIQVFSRAANLRDESSDHYLFDLPSKMEIGQLRSLLRERFTREMPTNDGSKANQVYVQATVNGKDLVYFDPFQSVDTIADHGVIVLVINTKIVCHAPLYTRIDRDQLYGRCLRGNYPNKPL